VGTGDDDPSFIVFCADCHLVWWARHEFRRFIQEDRRDVVMSFSTIAKWIIALVILFIVAVLINGSLDKEKWLVKTITETIKIGQDKEIGTVPSLPAQEAKAVNGLKRIISDYPTYNTGCFIKYGPLPELKNTILELIYEQQKTYFVVSDLNGREIERSIVGVKPCVIANYANVENFHLTFFEKQRDQFEQNRIDELRKKGMNEPEIQTNRLANREERKENSYLSINYLKLSFDDENQITSGTTISGVDGLWLYNPDGKNICFFPTYDDWFSNCNPDEDEQGMDNDCFNDPAFEKNKCVAQQNVVS